MERLNLSQEIFTAAHNVGKFVMKHVQVGGWGETATDIQPPHVNIEPTLGEE